MNYFDFYGLEMSFSIDEETLRKTYLTLSKKYHPDFHSLASEKEQAAILEKSVLNNEAYHTLREKDSRIRYILTLHGLLDEHKNKTAIPQDFLMEMMEVNETLMELEFDFNKEILETTIIEIEKIKQELEEGIEKPLASFSPSASNKKLILEQVLSYYLKSRYIKRIENHLERLQKN